MELITRLDGWFADQLAFLRCSDTARAYVTRVLATFRVEDDMSRESIVIAFSKARRDGGFVEYQRIGDWTLWASAMAPESIRSERDVIETLGRLSYLACYRFVREWPVYEELADELPAITRAINARCSLSSACRML